MGDVCTPGVSREREAFQQVELESWGHGIVLLTDTLNDLSSGCDICTWCLFFLINQIMEKYPEQTVTLKAFKQI